jgi:hypothetical protein
MPSEQSQSNVYTECVPQVDTESATYGGSGSRNAAGSFGAGGRSRAGQPPFPTLDDARLPDDPRLRSTLKTYFRWATEAMSAHPGSADDVAAGLALASVVLGRAAVNHSPGIDAR